MAKMVGNNYEWGVLAAKIRLFLVTAPVQLAWVRRRLCAGFMTGNGRLR